jgi:hypothetical protein
VLLGVNAVATDQTPIDNKKTQPSTNPIKYFSKKWLVHKKNENN